MAIPRNFDQDTELDHSLTIREWCDVLEYVHDAQEKWEKRQQIRHDRHLIRMAEHRVRSIKELRQKIASVLNQIDPTVVPDTRWCMRHNAQIGQNDPRGLCYRVQLGDVPRDCREVTVQMKVVDQ